MSAIYPEVIAHRGLSSEYPENTLIAVGKAIEAGVKWIEVDVHLSYDGKIIIIHDETVDRTTNGHGFAGDMTSPELKALDAGSWKNSAFKKTRIPLLDEMLELVKGRARINIEIKCGFGIITPLIETIELFGMEKEIKLSCFNLNLLKIIKDNYPDFEMGALLEDDKAILSAINMGFNDLHLPIKYLNGRIVNLINEHNGRSFYYTVNNMEALERCISLGVDGIFSDCADKFVR
ncbi:MAG: glycerophosphodiester phosphodiesterase family protein [bacterium]